MVLHDSVLGGYSASGTMYRTLDVTQAFHLTSTHKQVNGMLTDRDTHFSAESISGEQKALDKLQKN